MKKSSSSGSIHGDWRQQRRQRGVELYQKGWRQEEIAEALGVTQGAVSQWVTAYRQHGQEGIQARKHPGPAPKLEPERLGQLPALLEQGAEAHGFRGAVWTAARIAEVIERHFGVHYHPDHAGHLVRGLGWSQQKPLKRERKRNEAAIDAFREDRFPTLKRGHRSKEAPSSSSMRVGSTPSRRSPAPTRHGGRHPCSPLR